MKATISRPSTIRGGFTLVELIVTISILVAIMALTGLMVSGTQNTIRTAKGEASQFREARRAFDTISSRLSQATLNTYWDYDDPSAPTKYIRQSELHFVSGGSSTLLDQTSLPGHAVFFQAPFGYAGGDADESLSGANDPYRDLESLLNAWGFFVDYTEDPDVPPFIRAKSWFSAQSRFRLMEFRQPSEKLAVYAKDLREEGIARAEAYNWFRAGVNNGETRVVANNILALILRPQRSVVSGSTDDPYDIAPDYAYDSIEHHGSWGSTDNRTERNHNQLPPLMEVTMVAVDDQTWSAYLKKNNISSGGSAPNLISGSYFQDAESYDSDLEKLQRDLTDAGLEHRIFSATIGMRTAKWSDD